MKRNRTAIGSTTATDEIMPIRIQIWALDGTIAGPISADLELEAACQGVKRACQENEIGRIDGR